MKTLKLPKGRGYRIVVVPSAQRKADCRDHMPRLMAAAMLLDRHGVQHGFTPGRSPVTNAARHVGFEWTATWDLEDCFEHVTRAMVPIKTAEGCWDDGVARQGLPSSPALANIALVELDTVIVRLLGRRGVYTRYADDITVSTNDKRALGVMLDKVPALAEAHGFPVAAHKTRVQWARAGRRMVTGVAVDSAGTHAPRETRRRLRAAKHQAACLRRDASLLADSSTQLKLLWLAEYQALKAGGLAEWCALKRPNWARSALRYAYPPLTAAMRYAATI